MRKSQAKQAWTLIALGVAVTAIWIAAPCGGSSERSRAGSIMVVAGPTVAQAAAAPPAAVPSPSPAAADPSARIAVAAVTRAYPMLSNAALECAGERCTLTGTIRPPHGQADLDKRQEMLLGGLKATLAASGYDMLVPFQMDEIDDNTFRLQAAVTRIRERNS